MPTLHLLISGKVQGVFYRAAAKETAAKLSLTGWIKNTADGNVHALVTGNQQHLEEFVQWCRTGPRRAEVQHVAATEQPEESFDSFTVIRD